MEFYDERYAPVGQKILFENERIRVWEILLQPGERHPTHHHLLPYLVLAVEGDQNKMEWEDGKLTTSYEPPGFFVYREAGAIHDLTNIGSKRYWSRLIEFKTPQAMGIPDSDEKELLIDTHQGQWRTKSLPGLSEMRLWDNQTTGASISLVRFQAGSGIPDQHHHASNQFMFCLSGEYEYVSSGLVLKPGSFYWNPKGHLHGPTRAHKDSLLLEIYDGPHYPQKPSWYRDEQDAK
jgi:quercetin dioxygenase-like cupin family protein